MAKLTLGDKTFEINFVTSFVISLLFTAAMGIVALGLLVIAFLIKLLWVATFH